MANIAAISRADRASESNPALQWVAGALVVGAIGFNAVLCFLNTRGFAISNLSVMMSEALLISAALLACRDYLNITQISVLAAVIFYTAALSALRYANVPGAGFDPKVTRDLIIPISFFVLGKAVGDIKAADRIVLTGTAIVLAFALFEFFFLDSFLKVFGVAEYYIARGTLDSSSSALNISQGLMASGIRPSEQGRTLFAFLGEHRVSSIFLEPITLGNFGTLVTLWAVLRSRMEGRFYFWLALSGLALIVLSDGRFDACFVALGVVVLLAPVRIATLVAYVLPFVVIAALFFWGAVDNYDGSPEIVEGLGVYDRVLYTARVLYHFDALNWLGLAPSQSQTFDAGYAYVISNIGIIGFAAIWVLLMALPATNRYFAAFRNVTAFYFATLLCISNSPFTIKIAAPLWFLLGVLFVQSSHHRGTARARGARGSTAEDAASSAPHGVVGQAAN